jgi:hypothetical protein
MAATSKQQAEAIDLLLSAGRATQDLFEVVEAVIAQLFHSTKVGMRQRLVPQDCVDETAIARVHFLHAHTEA